MIILENVTKFAEGDKRRRILSEVHARLPSTRRIAVLGPRPQDNKTFINLLAGSALPESGRIIRRSRVSFPAGYRGGFTPNLTVRVNIAHVSRLYNADVESVVEFVRKFCRLGAAFERPYRDLSSLAKRDLAQILSFCIPFDVYLLSDDLLAFQSVRLLFEERCKTSGIIMAAKDPVLARQFCDMGVLLAGGRVQVFKRIDRAIAAAQEVEVEASRNDKAKRGDAKSRQGELPKPGE